MLKGTRVTRAVGLTLGGLVALAVMFGAAAGLAKAAPVEHEYDLVTPSGDGTGEEPEAALGGESELRESTSPAVGSSVSGTSSTPAASTSAEPPPSSGEVSDGAGEGRRAESPLRGETYAFVPREPTDDAAPRPTTLAGTTSAGTTSAGGAPGALIVVSGLALLATIAAVWRWHRRRQW